MQMHLIFLLLIFFILLIAKQENAGKFSIQHLETGNPYFVVTKIDEAKQ